MLVMPCWHGPAHPLGRGDASLRLLVDELLTAVAPAPAPAAEAAAEADAKADAAEPAAEADAEAAAERPAATADAGEAAEEPAAELDVRRVTAGISARLAAAAAEQLEDARAAGVLSEEEAVAAVAVVEAAVSGSAAVAAAAAAAAAAPAAAPETADVVTSPLQPQRERLKRQLAEAEGAAAEEAVPQERLSKKQRREMAAAATEAAAARHALAVKALVLAAATALEGGPAAEAGATLVPGATLAEINLYLNQFHPRLSKLLLSNTAKKALQGALRTGLLQPAGTPGAAAAAGDNPTALTAAGTAALEASRLLAEAAAAADAPNAATLPQGLRYCLTLAGAAVTAAMAGQYILALDAYCGQFPHQGALFRDLRSRRPQAEQRAAAGGKKKRQRRGSQAQELEQPAQQPELDQPAQPQQPQQPGAAAGVMDVDAGFFWDEQPQGGAAKQPTAQQASEVEQPIAQAEQQIAQQASEAEQQAPQQPPEQASAAEQQPPQQGQQGEPAVEPPPALAGADEHAIRFCVLLHAVAALQARRGVGQTGLEAWVQQQLEARQAGASGAPTWKHGKNSVRNLRSLLSRGLCACEKVRSPAHVAAVAAAGLCLHACPAGGCVQLLMPALLCGVPAGWVARGGAAGRRHPGIADAVEPHRSGARACRRRRPGSGGGWRACRADARLTRSSSGACRRAACSPGQGSCRPGGGSAAAAAERRHRSCCAAAAGSV